ncbi:hypothetical protein [Burkholderia ambifaria]|nr:hypothetical protein [Burkholderia ambifaria]
MSVSTVIRNALESFRDNDIDAQQSLQKPFTVLQDFPCAGLQD